jgi:hypothetical protein
MAMHSSASICSELRSGATDYHQRREHRPKFLNQAERDRRAQQFFRAEFLQVVIALQPKHHTGKEAGDQDHDERSCADEVDLPDDGVGRIGGFDDIDQGHGQKDAHPARAFEQVQKLPAELLDHVAHGM